MGPGDSSRRGLMGGVVERLIAGVKAWGETGLGLFFPNVCQVCREERATAEEGYVCGGCWARPDGVQFIVPPFCRVCGLAFEGEVFSEFECGNCKGERLYFRGARSAVKYTGLMQEVILGYKYNGAVWFEPFLADLVIRHSAGAITPENYDAIVPVPLYWTRRWRRSFNQAEQIGARLSVATGVPLKTRLLKRVVPTSTQTRLTRAQRAGNVRNAFAVRENAAVRGLRIVLVDDVMTTGATASACARVLLQKGAEVVDVWTVARGMLQ